jgi:hypothetical protein
VKDVKDIWTCIGGRCEGYMDLYWWKIRRIYGLILVEDVKDMWTCIGGRCEGYMDLYWWKI